MPPDSHSVESEDWLRKAAWDLPTNWSDFLHAISRPGLPAEESLRLFMDLPAARAMPAPLKRQLFLEGYLTKGGKAIVE